MSKIICIVRFNARVYYLDNLPNFIMMKFRLLCIGFQQMLVCFLWKFGSTYNILKKFSGRVFLKRQEYVRIGADVFIAPIEIFIYFSL